MYKTFAVTGGKPDINRQTKPAGSVENDMWQPGQASGSRSNQVRDLQWHQKSVLSVERQNHVLVWTALLP
jgi:hypothetical protein